MPVPRPGFSRRAEPHFDPRDFLGDNAHEALFLSSRFKTMAASPTGELLIQQALSLPVPDRVEVLQRLWDSLPADSGDPFLSPALVAELERRVAHEDAHPQEDLTWDDVKAGVPRQS
jgi:putative addiction module component (TIGR02574 family)